jgi:hypothetical protein
MKKISTAGVKQSENFRNQHLTIAGMGCSFGCGTVFEVSP